MNNRETLAFISPRFLFPTDSGGKIRTTQVLRGLKGGAFRIVLVMPSTDDEREQYARHIESVCDELVSWEEQTANKLLNKMKKVAWLAGGVPVSVRSDWDRTGAATIRQVLRQGPGVVVFDFPHSAILAPGTITPPSVMFTHNIEAEIFHRHWQVAKFPVYKWIWRDQYRKMRSFENSTLSRFDTVIAVSDRDRRFFESEYSVSNCRTIPTGVDTEFFSYGRPVNSQQVVFCGSMDWMANIDGITYFYEEIWPSIHRAAPDARMKVVGRAPPPQLVNRIRKRSPEWEFTGFVEDVRDHIQGAAAFVIPLRVGGGTRIKAFEAMAMGTPVVSTPVGVEGLPIADGQHYLSANGPSAFADNVIRLLDEPDLRSELSIDARSLVESKYGFRSAAKKFEKICLDTVNRQRVN